MKNNILLTLCGIVILTCSCKKKTTTMNENTLNSGIHTEYMDQSVRPQDDFYQYACGGWMKLHPLPDEYSRYGSFDKLAEDNLAQLKSIVLELTQANNEHNSLGKKISTLYALGMDSATCNLQQAAPIMEELNAISHIQNLTEVGPEAAKISLYASNPFIGIFGEVSPVNSDMQIAWVWQSGLGIGDRDYYLDKKFQHIREQYTETVAHLLNISKYSTLEAFNGKEQQMAVKILNLETQMAEAFISKEELRQPEKTVHLTTVAELNRILPNMNIPAYMKVLNLKIDSVNIGMPDYFKKLNRILSTTDLKTLKAYLAWTLIRSAAPYLSDEFTQTHFNFYGTTLSGKKEQQARWKRVIHTIDDCMGEALGKIYVEKYFPKEAKQRMTHMVSNLQKALENRMLQAQWMSEDTKKAAVNKLSAFQIKIGYPDHWRNYDHLNINKKSYWENVSEANKFNTLYELAKIGLPVNKEEWLMTPQTVNAYYNPSTNEICFPAAILQPPFFDMNADDAANYGAIGVVIGHEMTHGFDDQGRKYDAKGNLNEWWNEQDAKNFGLRAQVLVDWFNNIEVQPGLHANGLYTLGENIADNGGLNIAYTAMQTAKKAGEIKTEMDGFSADQRFFIAYATVWASNIREEEIVRRTQEDPHSLGRWRVNGTLPHISSFAKAFNVKEGDAMYLAPEKQAHIW